MTLKSCSIIRPSSHPIIDTVYRWYIDANTNLMRMALCLCWALKISRLHVVSLWRNDCWLCAFRSIHKNVIIAACLDYNSFSSSLFVSSRASECRKNDRFNMSDTLKYCVSDMIYSNWKVSLSASVVVLHRRKIDSCQRWKLRLTGQFFPFQGPNICHLSGKCTACQKRPPSYLLQTQAWKYLCCYGNRELQVIVWVRFTSWFIWDHWLGSDWSPPVCHLFNSSRALWNPKRVYQVYLRQRWVPAKFSALLQCVTAPSEHETDGDVQVVDEFNINPNKHFFCHCKKSTWKSFQSASD